MLLWVPEVESTADRADPRETRVSPWRGRINAEVYDRFVRDHRIYRRLNTHLALLARLAGARRVLDLACGTGGTALACLRFLDFDADLVGVDASEAMVEVARANILDRRARFLVAAASSVDRTVRGPFDRAVCNAAFWQFPAPGPVLAALANVLSAGALFVFNVPAERVVGEASPVHPYQVALARAIEARTGRPFPASPASIDPTVLRGLLDEHGFELQAMEQYTYEGRQRELIELMNIPAMIEPLTPELGESARAAALDEARSKVLPDEPVQVPWAFFVARFGGAAPPSRG
jgi:SAM-dependent methyltransferase